MALTSDEIIELKRIINARNALRSIARDPIKRRKQFKIVPGAALSKEAARLAQFYEQAPPEHRAALDTLMSLFTAGMNGGPTNHAA